VNPLWQRVVAALGANAFGQGVNILIQLASLPVFLHVWDTADYGTWLMLSALPAYLGMADVGMVATACNRMTMAVGRGDGAEANRVFQSALCFMLITCGSLAALSLAVVLLDPMHWLADADQRMALAALMLGVVVTLFGGVAESVFKASGRYAQGTMYSNLVRLAEWGASIVGLLAVGSFTAVALGALLVRVAGTLWVMAACSAGSHPFRWGLTQARRSEVVAMIKPAVSFMAFPVANALTFQGGTLLVGHLFGAAAVAVFSTYRTLSRVAVQITGIFGHSLWAEFSRLYGQSGAIGVASVYRRAATAGSALSMLLSVALYVASPWLLAMWTHGRIGFQPVLMATLLAYAAVGGSWHVPRVLLMATNQHVGLAQWCLAFAVLTLLLAWAMGSTMGLGGVGTAMLLCEAGIALVCVAHARRLTQPREAAHAVYAQ
jgi:O-antigen/teichoic acid export membrane protein